MFPLISGRESVQIATMKKFTLIAALLAVVGLISMASADEIGSISAKTWGKTADGKEVVLYTLTNAKGMTMTVTNRGATIVSLTAPDYDGKFENVVVGYDSIDKYDDKTPYFGAFIGRYGNRIANGKFSIDGKEFNTEINEPSHNVTLHGGKVGFDKKVYFAMPTIRPDGPSVTFFFESKDGEQGFPGTMRGTVTYTLTNNNELVCHYIAFTDKPTVCNLTNHTYFNLSAGDLSKENLNATCQLKINAKNYNPVDKNLIPTGIAPVEDTPFDFREFKEIGEDHGADCEQFKFTNGYDHNFVLDKGVTKEPEEAAVLKDPISGRVMTVLTTEPGVQFYAGVALDGSNIVNGKPVNCRSTVCLETQHYPDSPNHPDFPSTILRPGQKYESTTIYRFSVEE